MSSIVWYSVGRAEWYSMSEYLIIFRHQAKNIELTGPLARGGDSVSLIEQGLELSLYTDYAGTRL